MMNPGDEVLYPNPGYPIYESMIEFHGGKAVPYGYIEGQNNFDIDTDMLAAKITPRTKLLVLNDLQNPTGAECSKKELEKIAAANGFQGFFASILAKNTSMLELCKKSYFSRVKRAGSSQYCL